MNLKRSLLATVATVLALGVGYVWSRELEPLDTARPRQPSAQIIRVAGVYPEYTREDLAAQSDAVAIIQALGDPRVHWNSADNTPWALDQVGLRSHIVRDQEMVVDEVLSGSVPGTLVLRGFGGTVGDVTVEYEEEPTLVAGQRYLAFLRSVDLPTRDGFEKSWILVFQQNGLFTLEPDGSWKNPAALRITQEEAQEVAP